MVGFLMFTELYSPRGNSDGGICRRQNLVAPPQKDITQCLRRNYGVSSKYENQYRNACEVSFFPWPNFAYFAFLTTLWGIYAHVLCIRMMLFQRSLNYRTRPKHVSMSRNGMQLPHQLHQFLILLPETTSNFMAVEYTPFTN